jgi:hypothetical protein
LIVGGIKQKEPPSGSVAKNLAVLQNQLKTSQIEYLYTVNRLIIIQKARVIA